MQVAVAFLETFFEGEGYKRANEMHFYSFHRDLL
jgi:hypothetical protein